MAVGQGPDPFLPVSVSHQAVSEIKESVKMMGPVKSGGAHAIATAAAIVGFGIKKTGECSETTNDIPGTRVNVRMPGKVSISCGLPRGSIVVNWSREMKSFHTHSLYRREVHPAINPAMASSRNGPSFDNIPGFF